MPENPGFEIATRQRADLLFRFTVPLGAGSSVVSDIRDVLGYDSIAILAISDQAFTIGVEEACTSDGDFSTTQVLTSALVNGLNQICTRILPCGAFMKLTVTNTGAPMTVLDVASQGIPEP